MPRNSPAKPNDTTTSQASSSTPQNSTVERIKANMERMEAIISLSKKLQGKKQEVGSEDQSSLNSLQILCEKFISEDKSLIELFNLTLRYSNDYDKKTYTTQNPLEQAIYETKKETVKSIIADIYLCYLKKITMLMTCLQCDIYPFESAKTSIDLPFNKTVLLLMQSLSEAVSLLRYDEYTQAMLKNSGGTVDAEVESMCSHFSDLLTLTDKVNIPATAEKSTFSPFKSLVVLSGNEIQKSNEDFVRLAACPLENMSNEFVSSGIYVEVLIENAINFICKTLFKDSGSVTGDKLNQVCELVNKLKVLDSQCGSQYEFSIKYILLKTYHIQQKHLLQRSEQETAKLLKDTRLDRDISESKFEEIIGNYNELEKVSRQLKDLIQEMLGYFKNSDIIVRQSVYYPVYMEMVTHIYDDIESSILDLLAFSFGSRFCGQSTNSKIYFDFAYTQMELLKKYAVDSSILSYAKTLSVSSHKNKESNLSWLSHGRNFFHEIDHFLAGRKYFSNRTPICSIPEVEKLITVLPSKDMPNKEQDPSYGSCVIDYLFRRTNELINSDSSPDPEELYRYYQFFQKKFDELKGFYCDEASIQAASLLLDVMDYIKKSLIKLKQYESPNADNVVKLYSEYSEKEIGNVQKYIVTLIEGDINKNNLTLDNVLNHYEKQHKPFFNNYFSHDGSAFLFASCYRKLVKDSKKDLKIPFDMRARNIYVLIQSLYHYILNSYPDKMQMHAYMLTSYTDYLSHISDVFLKSYGDISIDNLDAKIALQNHFGKIFEEFKYAFEHYIKLYENHLANKDAGADCYHSTFLYLHNNSSHILSSYKRASYLYGKILFLTGQIERSKIAIDESVRASEAINEFNMPVNNVEDISQIEDGMILKDRFQIDSILDQIEYILEEKQKSLLQNAINIFQAVKECKRIELSAKRSAQPKQEGRFNFIAPFEIINQNPQALYDRTIEALKQGDKELLKNCILGWERFRIPYINQLEDEKIKEFVKYVDSVIHDLNKLMKMKVAPTESIDDLMAEFDAMDLKRGNSKKGQKQKGKGGQQSRNKKSINTLIDQTAQNPISMHNTLSSKTSTPASALEPTTSITTLLDPTAIATTTIPTTTITTATTTTTTTQASAVPSYSEPTVLPYSQESVLVSLGYIATIKKGTVPTFTKEIMELIDEYNQNNGTKHWCFIYGGFCRDVIFGKKPHDIDMVTSMSRDLMISLLGQVLLKYKFNASESQFIDNLITIQANKDVKQSVDKLSIDFTCLGDNSEAGLLNFSNLLDLQVNTFFMNQHGEILDRLMIWDKIFDHQGKVKKSYTLDTVSVHSDKYFLDLKLFLRQLIQSSRLNIPMSATDLGHFKQNVPLISCNKEVKQSIDQYRLYVKWVWKLCRPDVGQNLIPYLINNNYIGHLYPIYQQKENIKVINGFYKNETNAINGIPYKQKMLEEVQNQYNHISFLQNMEVSNEEDERQKYKLLHQAHKSLIGTVLAWVLWPLMNLQEDKADNIQDIVNNILFSYYPDYKELVTPYFTDITARVIAKLTELSAETRQLHYIDITKLGQIQRQPPHMSQQVQPPPQSYLPAYGYGGILPMPDTAPSSHFAHSSDSADRNWGRDRNARRR